MVQSAKLGLHEGTHLIGYIEVHQILATKTTAINNVQDDYALLEKVPTWRNSILSRHDSGFKVYIMTQAANQFPDKFVQTCSTGYFENLRCDCLAGVNKHCQNMMQCGGYFGFFLMNMPQLTRTCSEAVTLASREALQRVNQIILLKILKKLLSGETYLTNFLLLRAYTASAKHFADDAVSELCNKTWRFQCGYSDSPYWDNDSVD